MNFTYNFTSCYEQQPLILTEASVGLRIQHEYGIQPWKNVQVAGLIYDEKSRAVLSTIYREYLQVAQDYLLPILLMTNTRRANRERAEKNALPYSVNTIPSRTTLFIKRTSSCAKEAYIKWSKASSLGNCVNNTVTAILIQRIIAKTC